MKRTYRKTVVRTIRQSLSRFLAIFAIVALGVGFLAGLLATTPDMRYSADRFFDETDLFDLRIVGTLGLTDEDVEAVRAIDGVEQVMPAYSSDAIVNTPSGDALVARIQSVPLDQIEAKEPEGYLNRMEVVEGRLPVKEDECVVEEGSDYHAMGFSVGDTLPISPENEDWEDTFARNELKVVGVVSTSAYFSIERESASVGDGTVDVVLYTGEQNFTLDVWTDIYVQVAGAKAYDSLTDAYTDYVDLTAQKIEDISGERSRIRYEQVKTEAEEALADATAEYEDAKAEAEQKLADAEEELGDGRSEIEENEKKLENAQKEIDSGQAELDANKESLPGTLSAKQQQLADAQAKLIDAKAEYEDGVAQVEQKSQELESAKQQLEQAKQLVRLLEPTLTQAQEALPKLQARVFPVFFFLVAALVALTTMTRMVEEERLQIGTMKALGYSKKSIMAKYVIYAMTATVAGCVFGLLVGFNLFPTVIWNAYSMMYTLPRIYCLFNAPYAAIASGAAILCTLAATLNACWATLMETPATLMLPKAPKAGKRILLERVRPVWKRMKFTHKVTARNLFRYKKRFFMTVVGIAGCTALLVTGFGLHDSISDIVNKQFGKVFTYDFTVSVRAPEEFEGSELEQVLGDTSLVTDWTLVHQEQSENEFGDITFETYLFVPEESSHIGSFVDLHERKSGEPVAFSETGVVISEKMSERANLSVGDTVTLENKDGRTGTFRVDGIVENYVENYVYMRAETYEAAFGQAPEFDLVLGHAADDSAEGRAALNSTLLKTEGVAGVSQINDLKNTFSGMMQKIDIIVVVLIVSAGVLAFVVLYNLTNINITERTKEIATIKVLGFYDSEVSAYVYRESVALSVIGTLVGLVLGIFLHMFVIHSVEVDAVMFGRTIKPMSYVFSALLTLVFSALVNLVMHRKLRHISMVESMKAPE